VSAFARTIGTDTRPAPRTVTLAPEDFAESWRARPTTAIVLGIRVPSERDFRAADFEAAKLDTPEAYNQKAMDIIVSRGICDPNDILAEHSVFPVAEETLPAALKPRAIKRVFDEIERLGVDQSPIYEEASPSDMADLWSFLSMDEPFTGMSDVDAARCRRYLKFALEHFQAVETEADDEA
jgi:hypothetical protein